jgi:hypothetical protein
MKWKTETTPCSGEKRTVEYFALLPTKLDDGFTVWLQKYWAVETWDDGTTGVGFGYWKTNRTSIEHPNKPSTGSNYWREDHNKTPSTNNTPKDINTTPVNRPRIPGPGWDG